MHSKKLEFAESVKLASEALGYTFENPELLQEALTHPSLPGRPNYERLEFLGDSVLSFVISSMVFTMFPKEAEGALSRRHIALVNKKTLEELARKIDVHKFIITSPTETPLKLQNSALENALEAIIAALYIDGGLEIATNFIEKYWGPLASSMREPPSNFKTELQEWTQKNKMALPAYKLVERSGLDHDPLFTISVEIPGYDAVYGTGKTKRDAEQEAARIALDNIGENGKP